MSFFGVIADDLTGAMDAGIQMLNKNRVVRVALSMEHLTSITENTDFVVVNTQSRNGTSDEAYRKTAVAMKQLFKRGCNIVYKKIDSTLRGHIGAEIKAVLDSGIFDCIVVAPALPFNKRTTENGIHFVGGVRLADTELAKDPFSPLSHSAIADIIREEFDTQIGLLHLEAVRKGSLHIIKEMDALVEKGVRIIVVDAVEETDLKSIASAAKSFGRKKMLCGSAGFFQYFDEAYIIGCCSEKTGRDFSPIRPSAPMLVVSGSPAEMSKKQIEYFAMQRQDVSVIHFDIMAVSEDRVSNAIKYVREEVLCHLKNGRHVVVDAAGRGKEAILKHSLGDREKLDSDSSLVRRLISDVAYAAISHTSLCGLVLFGGDTAVAVTERLNATGIEIVEQIEPYIPKGTLMGGAFSGLPVVTKAGGFGKEDSLVTILNSFI